MLSNPGKVHYRAAIRVLIYLRGTSDRTLTYSPNASLGLDTYVDSSWSSKFSCSGAMYFMHGCLFHWFSKMQRSVTLSSAEAEYFGAMLAARDLIFIRELLIELGLTVDQASRLLCDSKSAVDMAFDPVAFKKTKHILRAAEFLRDLVLREVIVMAHLSGSIMIADVLTKAVARALFVKLIALVDEYHVQGIAAPPPPTAPVAPMPDETSAANAATGTPPAAIRLRGSGIASYRSELPPATRDALYQHACVRAVELYGLPFGSSRWIRRQTVKCLCRAWRQWRAHVPTWLACPRIPDELLESDFVDAAGHPLILDSSAPSDEFMSWMNFVNVAATRLRGGGDRPPPPPSAALHHAAVEEAYLIAVHSILMGPYDEEHERVLRVLLDTLGIHRATQASLRAITAVLSLRAFPGRFTRDQDAWEWADASRSNFQTCKRRLDHSLHGPPATPPARASSAAPGAPRRPASLAQALRPLPIVLAGATTHVAIRPSPFGGVNGRGLFATADLPAGTVVAYMSHQVRLSRRAALARAAERNLPDDDSFIMYHNRLPFFDDSFRSVDFPPAWYTMNHAHAYYANCRMTVLYTYRAASQHRLVWVLQRPVLAGTELRFNYGGRIDPAWFDGDVADATVVGLPVVAEHQPAPDEPQ